MVRVELNSISLTPLIFRPSEQMFISAIALSQLQILVRDRAFAGAGDVGGEFGEHAAWIMQFGWFARVHSEAPLGAKSL